MNDINNGNNAYNNTCNDQLIVLQFINCESLIDLWPQDFTPAIVFWSNTHQKSLVNIIIKTFYDYFNIVDEESDMMNQFIIEHIGNNKITRDNLQVVFNHLIKIVSRGLTFNCTIKEVTSEYIHKYKLIAYTTMLK